MTGHARAESRSTMKPLLRGAWRAALGVVSLLATAYLAAMALGILVTLFPGDRYAGKPRVAFEREAWLAAWNDREGSRYLMVEDLLAKHPLVGRPLNEVDELLGPRTELRRFGELGYVEWYLGAEPDAGGVDSALLRVVLRDDVVERVFVGSD